MVKPEEVKSAYDEFAAAETDVYKAEDEKIAAEITYNKAFAEGIEEAISDGITDPMKINRKGEKNSKNELGLLQEKEKIWRNAQLLYKQAGIKVDSLVRQMEAERLALQK